MRRIFFPLKSGVELFEDPTSPEAVTRAKEAAVLYDEVIFEDGLYDVSITPQGSTNFWTPPSQMTPERLEHSRRGPRVGEPLTLAMGKQRAAGQPAEEMSVFLQGEISASYVSEYYSGIIQELSKFEPPWARKVTIGGSDSAQELGEAAYDTIKWLNFSDFGDADLMPDTDSFLKSFIYKSFNRDSVLAAGMEASFSVTPLFAPMVSHRGLQPELAGSEALSVLVPDLTKVPWEAVVEYREHPGSSEARDLLRDFERLAQEEEPEDAYEFLRKVSQEVNKAYRAAIADLAPSFPEELAKEILLTAVSTISVIGAPLEKTASLISAAREARAFNRSWVAALMKIQEAPR
jgi:DNA-directed RNA polymerase subunit F